MNLRLIVPALCVNLISSSFVMPVTPKALDLFLFKSVLNVAESGDAFSQRVIGHYYRCGFGVEKDLSKAFEWSLKAARQGYDEEEFYEVGHCYAEGIGVEKNPKSSFKWLFKAARHGYKKAFYEVGRCYAEGIGIEKNPEKAFEWFLKAAELGKDERAFYHLSLCYAKGIGVEKDADKASKWRSKKIRHKHFDINNLPKLDTELFAECEKKIEEIATSMMDDQTKSETKPN